MRFRGKSVRRKIIALLLVPLLSLVAIWAFATAITAHEARQLLAVSSVSDHLEAPAEAAVHALQQERRETLVHLADPRSTEEALTESREATDEAVADIRRNAGSQARDDLHQSAADRLDVMLDSLERLDQLRNQVDSSTITRSAALEAYNGLTDPGLTFQSGLHLLEDVELDRHGRAVIGLSHAAEHQARSDALVAGALAAGRLTDKESRTLTEGTAERRLSYRLHVPDLPAEDRSAHESFWDVSHGQTLVAAEEAVLTHGASGVQAGRWQEINSLAQDELRTLAADARERYQDEVDPAATGVLIRAAVAGVVGLAAVVVSIVVSVRVGRGLVRDLRVLWSEARESAEVRLPSVMRRLGAGETVDVETEVPRLEYGRDEVGQVGQALNTLQRAAVEATVQQADMRNGISEVFVNLARRNQVLLHRQLSLLDVMERRTEDADELADLFRLDHLTTRMRRHAEGLVILSGAAPTRQWRKPVQLMDVVRGAVAEVEDYERIEVRRMPQLAVAGHAVADLTHLIAELLENATSFSPPHTAVQVHGERVPHGFTLEIDDRGLGMTSEGLAEVNHRLTDMPEFELSDTDRLGLFVVSRLARRLKVRVSLRESPYGGTTAVVMISGDLLSEALEGTEDRAPLPERPAPPALLDGPVDGPVELEAPVSTAGGDRVAAPESGAESNRAVRGPGPIPGRRPVPTGTASTDRDGPAATGQDPALLEHAAVGDREPPPLPQRRRSPILVAEHGRQVRRAPEDEPDYAAEPGRAPEPAPGHPVTEGGSEQTASGLPRRVRGAAAGPQHHVQADDTKGAPDDGRNAAPYADAEEARARMSSLQRGLQRGRRQNDSRSAESPSGTDAREGHAP